jgi:hypothetical protein
MFFTIIFPVVGIAFAPVGLIAEIYLGVCDLPVSVGEEFLETLAGGAAAGDLSITEAGIGVKGDAAEGAVFFLDSWQREGSAMMAVAAIIFAVR